MVRLLRKEWVEEKDIDLSLAQAPWPYHIISQNESRRAKVVVINLCSLFFVFKIFQNIDNVFLQI